MTFAEFFKHLQKPQNCMIIHYGVKEMLVDRFMNRFDNMSEEYVISRMAFADAMVKLANYRKLIGERLIKKDERYFRYVSI